MKKIWVFKSFVLIFASLFLVALFNFILDPLQQYRVAKLYKPHFTNARYLMPGLAKSFDYDSIVIGSSMTENFILSNITEVLNFKKPIKLASGGITAYESKVVLDVALKHKKIKNILYGLDFYSFSGDRDRLLHGEGSLPLYLYDNNYLNDYKYLLNIDTIKLGIKTILLQVSNYKSVELEYNRMFQWQHRYKDSDFNSSKIIEIFNNKSQKNLKNIDFNFKEFQKSFDYNILPIIKENPNINFYIFYPPYSIVSYIDSFQNGTIDSVLKFKEYISKVLSKFENVKLYDFQVAKEITFDLNNYRDTTHYHQKINYWILREIKMKNYLVDDKKAKKFNYILIDQIESYILNLNKKREKNALQ